ncbi:MAG: hypothetical protein OQJ95_05400, partial [Kangiella sp.]|nr:hypothetical protein [Kangiella sp.]
MVTSFRNKLIKNSGIAFIGRVLTLAFTLALTVLVTRSVSVEQSGLFFFITSAALFSSIIGRFGLEVSALRFISENIEGNRSLAYGIYWFCFKKVVKQSIISIPILVISLELSNFTYDVKILLPALAFSILLTWQYYIFEASRKILGIGHSVIFGGLLLYLLTTIFVLIYKTFFLVQLSTVFTLA